MKEIIIVFLVGLSLSLDAFSASLCIGTINISNRNKLLISVVVGIFHFVMPIIGLALGTKLLLVLHVSGDILLGIILLVLAFQMVKEYYSKEEFNFKFSNFGILLFAFSVSFDSFSAGIGLRSITTNYLFAAIVFSIFSFSFTLSGLKLGELFQTKLGKKANIIGAILLVIIAVVSILS